MPDFIDTLGNILEINNRIPGLIERVRHLDDCIAEIKDSKSFTESQSRILIERLTEEMDYLKQRAETGEWINTYSISKHDADSEPRVPRKINWTRTHTEFRALFKLLGDKGYIDEKSSHDYAYHFKNHFNKNGRSPAVSTIKNAANEKKHPISSVQQYKIEKIMDQIEQID